MVVTRGFNGGPEGILAMISCGDSSVKEMLRNAFQGLVPV
jgi:hypothetical protein